jgi:NAD(P)H-dependent FMN reductase
MRLLIVNGSPRMCGNSSKLVEVLIGILEEKGHQYYVVDEHSQYLTSCLHCGFCLDKKKCGIKDRVTFALDNFNEFDGVIIASPIYFFNLTPVALKVLTRLYSVDLKNKVFGLILSSGSNFRYGGADLIMEQFKRIDEYCGSTTATPYNKVTFDKILEATESDRMGIKLLVKEMEGLCNEIKAETSD